MKGRSHSCVSPRATNLALNRSTFPSVPVFKRNGRVWSRTRTPIEGVTHLNVPFSNNDITSSSMAISHCFQYGEWFASGRFSGSLMASPKTHASALELLCIAQSATRAELLLTPTEMRLRSRPGSGVACPLRHLNPRLQGHRLLPPRGRLQRAFCLSC
ncbi:hypothetical protein F442_12391 [Phytophthora nicotianae P10297]|uniref:Uncharacterized protein n=1 Tax=Phytophthora nicotianae P10297 TaxID=1317064 RepID=W2YZW4_PHYNI|nr:hypothetical protein F442_12391 [Phytophthora nicotianae P10297]